MIAIIGLLILLILSLTVVRIGSIAFELTGLSTDVAAFQAQSAFSGVGFTTSESETIVNHPVRRRIARTLILLGSVGITSTMATLIVALVGLNSVNFTLRSSFLAIGLLVIYILARAKVVYNLMKRMIVKALNKSKALQIHDYQELLGIGEGYSINQVVIKSDSWVSGQKLKDLEISKEGTLVLSIHRYVGKKEKMMIPSGETIIQPGDRLTLYGRCAACQCLSERPKGAKGEEAHQKRAEIEEKLKEIQETTGGFVEQH